MYFLVLIEMKVAVGGVDIQHGSKVWTHFFIQFNEKA